MNHGFLAKPRNLPSKLNTAIPSERKSQSVLVDGDQGEMSKLRKQLIDKLKISKTDEFENKSPIRLDQTSIDSAYFEPSTSTPEDRPASRLSSANSKVSPSRYTGQFDTPETFSRLATSRERPSSQLSFQSPLFGKDEHSSNQMSYVRFELSPGKMDCTMPGEAKSSQSSSLLTGGKFQSVVAAIKKRREQDNVDNKKRLVELVSFF